MIKIKRKRNALLMPLVWLGLVFLASCNANDPGSTGGSGLISHDGANMTVAFSSPDIISSLAIANLSAKLVLDGVSNHELNVDPITNAISGTITDVPIGSHVIEIIYFIMVSNREVILCQHSTQVDVVEGESTEVTLLDEDLDRNIDDDEDGHTNLAEVRSGTDPLSDLDFPTGGFPLIFAGNGTIQTSSSDNYTIKQIVGSTTAGSASSDSYDIVSSYIGSD